MTPGTRRLVPVLLMAAAVATVAACGNSTPTAPLKPSLSGGARIDGDTLECRSGWTIINGRYVCNGDS